MLRYVEANNLRSETFCEVLSFLGTTFSVDVRPRNYISLKCTTFELHFRSMYYICTTYAGIGAS